jgi:hypothetical protein
MGRFIRITQHGFWLKLAMVAALILAWDWIFWQQRFGLGNMGLFGLGLLAGLVVVRPATLSTLQGVGAVLAGAIYCAAILFHGSFLSFVLFWTAISVAALVPFASRIKDGLQWFFRLIVHGFASPFMPFMDFARLGKARKRAQGSKGKLRALFGLLALPVFGGLVFFALFVQANPILERLVSTITLPKFDEVLAGRMVVWAILAVLMWTLFRPWRRRGPAVELVKASVSTFKPPALNSITLSLIVFNALFLMQNGMDLAFMSQIVPLPDDMTLAQYAHRGAYPLIATALLAGLFVLIMLHPQSEAGSNKMARILVSVWIVQNVVLVASSMVRTWDYVEAYSLTQLRIAALAWMGLVGIGLALICWRLLRAKSGGWLINANLFALGLVLTGFCFVDTRALAAQFNVTHTREVGGRGVELDLCYMGRLGSGAIVPLMSLEQKPLPEAFRKRVSFVRQSLQQSEQLELMQGAWTWNLASNLAAAKALEPSLPKLDLGMRERLCDGNYYPEVVNESLVPDQTSPQPFSSPAPAPAPRATDAPAAMPSDALRPN